MAFCVMAFATKPEDLFDLWAPPGRRNLLLQVVL